MSGDAGGFVAIEAGDFAFEAARGEAAFERCFEHRAKGWPSRNIQQEFERTIESATTCIVIAAVNQITRRIASTCNQVTSL
ncbi:MAG: hypothetical protein KGK11_13760 [Sphingomonadales bacterium]|nr:hypothetical protein [Sphingomonadales bacterium]